MPEVISYGLVAELCRHLNQFVQARQECMKLYPLQDGLTLWLDFLANFNK